MTEGLEFKPRHHPINIAMGETVQIALGEIGIRILSPKIYEEMLVAWIDAKNAQIAQRAEGEGDGN